MVINSAGNDTSKIVRIGLLPQPALVGRFGQDQRELPRQSEAWRASAAIDQAIWTDVTKSIQANKTLSQLMWPRVRIDHKRHGKLFGL
jgi:hypothetical protein